MNSQEFDELAGRIEGIGRMVLALIADLEDRELLSGVRFSESLRSSAEALCFEGPSLASTKRTLLETADALDAARGGSQKIGRERGRPKTSFMTGLRRRVGRGWRS